MQGALKRMFEQLLEPEINWKEHIKTLINRIGTSGGFNWKQPDEWWVPHDFFAPKRSGKGAGWIVIWGDTSGSRSDKELGSNLNELAGILEDVNPARLTVLWCDAAIDHVDEIADAADVATIKARGTGGGGGTSVHPVFDWILENSAGAEPDLFIGFTDGEVGFPDQPKYPVIWASSTDAEYPYGSVVRVLKKGAR
jgi:predicted metal-dependent peptidase